MSQLTPEWETNLPKSLQNSEDLATLRQSVKQWSQLVSWSWTELLAFAGNEEFESQERKLKSYFIKTVQKQGQTASAYTSYGNTESKTIAEELGKNYKNLLLGRNQDIDYLTQEGVKLTLSAVLEKLTGEKYIVTEKPDMTEKFTFRVVLDTYTGSIIEIADKKYLAYMSYPPRPALSEITVSEEQLYDWAQNLNTLGDYLPPSPYIPIAGSC